MFLVYVVFGVFGGILSGMGLGGGTILIPVLTLVLGIFQKQAQFLNLFSFIFMSLFIIPINIKNKLTSVFPAIIFSLPGVITSIISSLLLKDISENLLKISFGVFLVVLGFVELLAFISKQKIKNKKI